jgi:vacuolar-type H+-ATPase subunit I/STV1
MKRHGSEGTRVSLTQRVRNFVGRLGSFMHRGCRQQAQELAQQSAQLRQELQESYDARHVLDEQNAMLKRQKEELERQKIELEQQVERQKHAYSALSEEARQIASIPMIESEEQLRTQLAEARKLSEEFGRRVELVDAQSEYLHNKVAAYERRESILNGRCLQLELRLDRLQHRIVTADVATQTEYPEGSPQVVSVVSHDDAAPSEIPPALPSMIDCVMSRRQIAESLYAVAGEGRAEVEGVLGQTRIMLELAQQRNKVDVTRTSGFGQTVDAALLTSYHPAQ